MKLGDVFVGREAWGRLMSQVKLPPRMGYELSRYVRLVNEDVQAIEAQRIKLVRETAGVKDGEDAKLDPGTREHANFLSQFGMFLDGDSQLQPANIGFDDLLNALDGDKGNALFPNDLVLLEPFFRKE